MAFWSERKPWSEIVDISRSLALIAPQGKTKLAVTEVPRRINLSWQQARNLAEKKEKMALSALCKEEKRNDSSSN